MDYMPTQGNRRLFTGRTNRSYPHMYSLSGVCSEEPVFFDKQFAFRYDMDINHEVVYMIIAIAFLLFVSVLLCAVSVSSAEEKKPKTFTRGNWEYTIKEDGTTAIVKYYGSDSDLVIPDQLDGKTVTGIGDSAFSFRSSLISVTIPDSVTSIGDNPFYCCEELSEIIVSPGHPYLAVTDGVLFSRPDKRLVCYPNAFTSESYSVPQGIQVIGNHAFFSCESLTSVTIPDSVTNIGDSAFTGCSSLTSVTIPDSVTSIGNHAFFSCESLTSVTIPDSITRIGRWTFSDCKALTSVTIPNSVTSIEDCAFSNCTSLASVTIPDSVTRILFHAFLSCDSLTVTVSRDSYAQRYCEENNIDYTCTEAGGS